MITLMSKCLDVIIRIIFTSEQKFMKSFSAYTLECCDNSYYTGYTDNLEARLEQHMFGETNSYVSSRKPFKLVWSAPSSSSGLEVEIVLNKLKSKLKIGQEHPSTCSG